MTALHVHQFGDPDGAPLLAIHGVTAHGGRFRRLGSQGWPDRRTLAVDLRGHGRSPDEGPWSVGQHVADLCDTLDALTIDRLDVVAHSYGGVIALALLAAVPHRVSRLVLLDPALSLPADTANAAALAVIDDPGWESIAVATIERQANVAPEAHAAVVDDLHEHLHLADDGRYRLRFHRPAAVTGWGEMCAPLPRLMHAAPSLLVVADQAPFVTPAIVERLRALLGDALTVAHLDCGHMVYWERFDETAALVRSFLDGADRRRAPRGGR